jgi:hypothetical protein
MPVSGDSLNQLALNCCVQVNARIELFYLICACSPSGLKTGYPEM